MNNSNSLLIEAFIEFVNKIIPALNEPILTNFKNKWFSFKEILMTKTPQEAYHYVQSMSGFITQYNYIPESGLSQKSNTSDSPPQIKRLTIDTNKTKEELKLVKTISAPDTHLITKMKREEFLKSTKKVVRKGFAEIVDQVQEAISIFKKNSLTIKAVYEHSSEIDTPQTPQVQYQPMENNRLIQPVMITPQPTLLKRYSFYGQRGFMQPQNFDIMTMQQMPQQKYMMKKIYF